MAKDARQLRAKRQHPARTLRSSEVRVMAGVVPPDWQKKQQLVRRHKNTETGGVAHVSTPKFAFDPLQARHSQTPMGDLPRKR